MPVNTLLTISMVTRESLRVLENHLVMAKHVNRELDSKFAVEGAKIGQVISVRKPPKYLGRSGTALSVEATTETSVPFVLDQQYGVDLEFSSAELLLSIDDFAKRILVPAVSKIANKIDSDIGALYNQIYQTVGTPGTTPSTLLVYLLAGVQLDNSAAPNDGQRNLFISPLMQAYIVDALKGLFQQSNAIAEQYMAGKMGVAAGYTWYMDQNVPTHTVGTYAGTPLVNGASQTGSSLITDGWTSSMVNQGDTFSVAGVYTVNPQSLATTPQLQKFVVTQTNTDAAGAMTIAISPAIITGGAYQTVSNSPADNAALTIDGATGTISAQGLLFHPDAITMASADLPLPGGVDKAGRISDKQIGISIRMVRAYDINTDNYPMRTDVLYGVGVLRPELAARVAA